MDLPAIVLAAVLIAVLIIYTIAPALERPGTVRVEGALYSYKTVEMPRPSWNPNSISQSAVSEDQGGEITPRGEPQMVVTYQNATFALWLSARRYLVLEGSISELSGKEFSFSLSQGPPSFDPDPWMTRISPDGLYGIQWDRGTTVRLLARI